MAYMGFANRIWSVRAVADLCLCPNGNQGFGWIYLLRLAYKAFKSAALRGDSAARPLAGPRRNDLGYAVRSYMIQMSNPKAALSWMGGNYLSWSATHRAVLGDVDDCCWHHCAVYHGASGLCAGVLDARNGAARGAVFRSL